MFCKTKLRFFAAFSIFCLIASSLVPVYSCSRILSSDNGQAVIFGRNFDWPQEFGQTDLYVLPRGIERDGGAAPKALRWKSKYGSMVAVTYAFDNTGGSSDGINETGLGANMLWLEKADYGVRNKKIPGFSIMLWAQYFLDNFATVDEAVKSLDKETYQVIPVAMKLGDEVYLSTLHLSLEDRSGDSAIIEYVGGKLKVHHNRGYTVMTNEPSFEEQLTNLKQYEGFGGRKPIPGTILPQDRFVRASYYMKYLPKPKNMRQALAHVFSVMANAAQPFSVSLDRRIPTISLRSGRQQATLRTILITLNRPKAPILSGPALMGLT